MTSVDIFDAPLKMEAPAFYKSSRLTVKVSVSQQDQLFFIMQSIVGFNIVGIMVLSFQPQQ